MSDKSKLLPISFQFCPIPLITSFSNIEDTGSLEAQRSGAKKKSDLKHERH